MKLVAAVIKQKSFTLLAPAEANFGKATFEVGSKFLNSIYLKQIVWLTLARRLLPNNGPPLATT